MEEAAKLCAMSSHLNVKTVMFKQHHDRILMPSLHLLVIFSQRRGLNEDRKTTSSLSCRAPLTSATALISVLGSKNIFCCHHSFTPHKNRINYFYQF